MSEHRGLKRVLAVLGLAGTAASIWWFALKPRRARRPDGGM
jgi:hypothetical protein